MSVIKNLNLNKIFFEVYCYGLKVFILKCVNFFETTNSLVIY